jgi:hypothetical protein
LTVRYEVEHFLKVTLIKSVIQLPRDNVWNCILLGICKSIFAMLGCSAFTVIGLCTFCKQHEINTYEIGPNVFEDLGIFDTLHFFTNEHILGNQSFLK